MYKFNTASGRNGDIAEKMVQLHYLQKGWEVFPNSSSHGPIDMVIIHTETGEVRYIDVKSKESWDRNKYGEVSNYKVKPTPLQVGLDVRFVYVERSTGTIREDRVY